MMKKRRWDDLAMGVSLDDELFPGRSITYFILAFYSSLPQYLTGDYYYNVRQFQGFLAHIFRLPHGQTLAPSMAGRMGEA
jgi:hypothetical protein